MQYPHTTLVHPWKKAYRFCQTNEEKMHMYYAKKGPGIKAFWTGFLFKLHKVQVWPAFAPWLSKWWLYSKDERMSGYFSSFYISWHLVTSFSSLLFPTENSFSLFMQVYIIYMQFAQYFWEEYMPFIDTVYVECWFIDAQNVEQCIYFEGRLWWKDEGE